MCFFQIPGIDIYPLRCLQKNKLPCSDVYKRQVLSIEEEQEIYRCLSQENFQTFREEQIKLFREILVIFGLPMDSIEPRLFGNLALSMMMVYKAIPDTMPFLFPEVAEDMVAFQINALLDEMQRAKEKINRVREDA